MAAGTPQGLAAFSAAHRLPPPAGGAPPSLVLSELEASLAAYLAAEADPEWEHATVNQRRPNLTVRSRRREESAALEFRCDVSLVARSADEVHDALLYENRIEWDPNVLSPAYLELFEAAADGLRVDVCGFCSRPAAMGLISGRAFADLRGTRRLTAADGAVEYVTTSVTPSAAARAAAAASAEWIGWAEAAGLVTARNLRGSGVRLREAAQPDGSTLVQWTMITCTELGGRLPVRLSNAATAGALAAFCLGLQKALDAGRDR